MRMKKTSRGKYYIISKFYFFPRSRQGEMPQNSEYYCQMSLDKKEEELKNGGQQTIEINPRYKSKTKNDE